MRDFIRSCCNAMKKPLEAWQKSGQYDLMWMKLTFRFPLRQNFLGQKFKLLPHCLTSGRTRVKASNNQKVCSGWLCLGDEHFVDLVSHTIDDDSDLIAEFLHLNPTILFAHICHPVTLVHCPAAKRVIHAAFCFGFCQLQLLPRQSQSLSVTDQIQQLGFPVFSPVTGVSRN